METDKNNEKNEKIEESPEEKEVQLEDNPDKFSDQEEDDDFFKIQIENFKNKTAKDFHKNLLLVDEKGRQVRSAKFSALNSKNFKKNLKNKLKKIIQEYHLKEY